MTDSNVDHLLREQLVGQLRGGRAFMTFADAIADFPLDHINKRVPNAPYTVWAILEHMRITQRDILDYIKGPEVYEKLDWPTEYWPLPEEIADPERWTATINQFLTDRHELEAIAQNPEIDLIAPLPHAPEHNILREILVAADHNAYHTGEFAALRQVMDTWPEGRA